MIHSFQLRFGSREARNFSCAAVAAKVVEYFDILEIVAGVRMIGGGGAFEVILETDYEEHRVEVMLEEFVRAWNLLKQDSPLARVHTPSDGAGCD